MPKHNPKKFFLTLSGITILITTGFIFYLMKSNLLLAYLISINLITFTAYGFDKHQAKVSGLRIPELILHLLALSGGTPAAAVGQMTFRHKTQKLSFRLIYFLIVIIQVVLTFIFIYTANRN